MEFINQIIQGDVVTVLDNLPIESVHCLVTSPPYWKLRRYGEGRWEGGDETCEHRTGRGQYDNVSAKQASNPGALAGDTKNICPTCGARRVESETSVSWPEVTYKPMAGIPFEMTMPAWTGELGQEPTPEMFIAHLVFVFRAARRVLRKDGLIFVNMGDSYNGSGKGPAGTTSQLGDVVNNAQHLSKQATNSGSLIDSRTDVKSLKNGDLCGMPWRLALALQADGWWLRSEIIWHKKNGMPQSMDDRPTTAHEQIFMLVKSNRPLYWTHADGRVATTAPKAEYRYQNTETGHVQIEKPEDMKARRSDGEKAWKRENLWQAHSYYFDQEAVREPLTDGTAERWLRGVSPTHKNVNGAPGQTPHSMNRPRKNRKYDSQPKTYAATGSKINNHSGYFSLTGEPLFNLAGRNIRSVWTFSSESFKGKHYATFPSKLPERCIKAGCPERVCPTCGAPHVRLIEKEHVNGGKYPNGAGGRAYQFGDPSTEQTGRESAFVATKTVGWQPTCKCGETTHVGGIVLDIFMGSGTTALVARQLGRRYVGIEISPKYAAMARDRLRLPFEKRESVDEPQPFKGPDTKGGNTVPMWEIV